MKAIIMAKYVGMQSATYLHLVSVKTSFFQIYTYKRYKGYIFTSEK